MREYSKPYGTGATEADSRYTPVIREVSSAEFLFHQYSPALMYWKKEMGRDLGGPAQRNRSRVFTLVNNVLLTPPGLFMKTSWFSQG